ncbi:MAG: hypothetical protein ACE5OZ_11370 [Candidatus Heimdallarchaeota archaeon]
MSSTPDACTEIADFSQLGTLVEGSIVNLEGMIIDCAPRVEMRKKKDVHMRQQLTVKSTVNNSSICVNVWNQDELSATPGQSLKVEGAVFKQGQVHVLQRGQLVFGHQQRQPSVTAQPESNLSLEETLKAIAVQAVEWKVERELEQLDRFAGTFLSKEKQEELRQLVATTPADSERLAEGQRDNVSISNGGVIDGIECKELKIKCQQCNREDVLLVKMNFEGTKKLSAQHNGHSVEFVIDKELNIDGIISGFTEEEGSKTVLPNNVFANMDIRLVPDMTVEDTRTKIQTFIQKIEPAAELSMEVGYRWSKMSPSHPYVKTLIEVLTPGKKYEIWPMLPGSAPFYIFQEKLDMPFLAGGLGHGSRAHSPNEYAFLESKTGAGGIIDFEISVARLLTKLAEVGKLECL